MKKILRVSAPLALLAVSALAVAQVRADEPPTVLERIGALVKQNPELRRMVEAAPPQMAEAAWMAGEWEIVQKRYGTPGSPEKVVRGTRRASLELNGRWLVRRDAFEDGDAVESFFGYLAYRRTWAFQFLSGSGMGTSTPLVSLDPWKDGRIELKGTISYLSENAAVTLRITRTGDSAIEVWEESVAGGRVRRPILETSLKRRK